MTERDERNSEGPRLTLGGLVELRNVLQAARDGDAAASTWVRTRFSGDQGTSRAVVELNAAAEAVGQLATTTGVAMLAIARG